MIYQLYLPELTSKLENIEKNVSKNFKKSVVPNDSLCLKTYMHILHMPHALI